MDDLLSFLARIRVYYLIVGWGLCIFFLAQFSLKYRKSASLKEQQDLAENAEEKETSKPEFQTEAKKDDEKKNDLKILFVPNQSTLLNPENWPTPIVAAPEDEPQLRNNRTRRAKCKKRKRAQRRYEESLWKEAALFPKLEYAQYFRTLTPKHPKQQKLKIARKRKQEKSKNMVARGK